MSLEILPLPFLVSCVFSGISFLKISGCPKNGAIPNALGEGIVAEAVITAVIVSRIVDGHIPVVVPGEFQPAGSVRGLILLQFRGQALDLPAAVGIGVILGRARFCYPNIRRKGG